jgi:hypothetical protein
MNKTLGHGLALPVKNFWFHGQAKMKKTAAGFD